MIVSNLPPFQVGQTVRRKSTGNLYRILDMESINDGSSRTFMARIENVNDPSYKIYLLAEFLESV
jgi:hypothetical protein